MSYQLTQTRELKVGLNECPFKKWDVIRTSSNGSDFIVIRVNTIWPGETTATMYESKKHNKKWKHWLWFKWLKLRVWVGDFYKK